MNSKQLTSLIKSKYSKLFSCQSLMALVVFSSFSVAAPQALAQQAPDAGALQNDIETPERPEPKRIPKPVLPPEPPQSPTGTQVPVTQFTFDGNQLLTDAELDRAVADWREKPLTIAELKYVTDLIAGAYRERGYLARVLLPEQDINDGEIRIVVVEAQFGALRIDGDEKWLQQELIDPEQVRAIVYRQQKRERPLQVDAIERATLLLNDLVGVSAQSVMVAGDASGYTDVAVTLNETPKYRGSVRVDNFGVRSTGEVRLIPTLQIANPLHRGDVVDFSGLLTEGNRYLRAGYQSPVTADGLKLGAHLSYLDYELGDEFEVLDAMGNALTIGADASYPLIRQVRNNLNLEAGLARRTYTDEQLGQEVSDKDILAFRVGVSGDVTDSLWGGGINFYGLETVIGDLDLSGNPINEAQDALDARTAGDYAKLVWNAARMQSLDEETYLWLSMTGQFGSRNLDSSETLSLGGPGGVRAYPSLEGTGDAGLIFNLEVRRRFGDDLLLSVFYDQGVVHQRRTNTQDKATENLKGLGASLDWSGPENFSARITIARRIGSNPFSDPQSGNDSNGEKELWPVWVSVNRSF